MDQFYFSSEIKALFAAKIPRNKNNKVWSNYLIYGTYGLPNETFWDTIHQLPAGHYLEIPINSNFVIKNLKPIRWYNFIERINQTNYSKKENLKEEYYNLLIKAIKYRFRSDVPLGMNLSGGLDSSILINLVSKNLPINQKIEAFTFYSNVEKYDELPWVKMLLKDKKYKLNEVLFLASEVPELITEISLHQDEPFGGFPTLAYSLLFKKASNKGIKVILDGQGMDEAWAGYDYYHNQTNAIIQGLNSSPVRPEILTNDFILFSDKENYPTPFNNNLQNLQYRDIFYTKIPRALRFNDRISMQYGTELREPFLDYKLVELAFVQDNNLKTPEDQTKKTLREIVKNNMNDKIVLAPKRPIQTPQREWIANELKDYFDEQINVFSNFDFVNKKQVINLWSSYCKGKKDNSFYIWQWVNLAILNK
jgi:asparagine synthase (glutamine-hydrolysing)